MQYNLLHTQARDHQSDRPRIPGDHPPFVLELEVVPHALRRRLQHAGDRERDTHHTAVGQETEDVLIAEVDPLDAKLADLLGDVAGRAAGGNSAILYRWSGPIHVFASEAGIGGSPHHPRRTYPQSLRAANRSPLLSGFFFPASPLPRFSRDPRHIPAPLSTYMVTHALRECGAARDGRRSECRSSVRQY